MTLLSTALAFIGLWGCEPDDIGELNFDYFLIENDTIRVSENRGLKPEDLPKAGGDPSIISETKNLPPKPRNLAPVPDFVLNDKEIRNQSSNGQSELNFMAFGSSYAAGVINGGYNNATMETSYPNLIARQLKLKNFNQPKFDNQNFNGFVTKERTENNDFTKGHLNKFAAANNNLATPGSAPIKGLVNNFSVPFIGRRALSYQFESLKKINGLEYRYLERFSKKNHSKIYDYYKDETPDFYTLENGIDDLRLLVFNNMATLLTYSSYARNAKFPEEHTSSAEIKLVHAFDFKGNGKKENTPKGFIATVPNLAEFPVCNLKSYNDGVKELGFWHFYYRNPQGEISEMWPEERFLPTAAVDSLFSKNVNMAFKKGLTKENPLEAKDIFYRSKIRGVENYIDDMNTHYAFLAEKYGVHLVDLNTLFTQIIKGQFVTWDGNKVDASYKGGNFFNEDGLSLTPFGQSILANTFLAKMNEIYKTNIPLISTSFYLTQSESK